MPFASLVGNEFAKTALLRMHALQRVPNTLLFFGPDGVGKGLFARAFASLLLNAVESSKLSHGNHPDLHIYQPEGKSGMHSIEAMRQLIDEVVLPPFEAPAKVFILHDAERMLPSSSNALLKTFEEPSGGTYIILLTSDLNAMLPTIVSRCRKISFFPIPQEAISTFAQKEWQKNAEEADRLALLAQGSLAKAKLLASGGKDPLFTLLPEVFQAAAAKDYPTLTKLLKNFESLNSAPSEDENSSEGRDEAKRSDLVLEAIFGWYRDLHLLKAGASHRLLYHPEQLVLLQKALTSAEIPSLEKISLALEHSRLALQRNIKLKSVLENFFLLSFQI